MKTVNLMLKPASSLCNMRCRYCFYADVAAMRDIPSHGIMLERTVDSLLRSLYEELSPGDCVRFAFQGGEPTLAGLPFFQSFVAKTKKWEGIRVTYALQTNGLCLDENWCLFLKEHRFLVGLSMELLPKAHDDARVDAAGKGTYSRVLQSLRLLQRHGVEYNVLCTLTKAVARQPEQVWDQLVRLGIDFVQFTPCLGPLEEGIRSPYALTPQLFAAFYTRLFACWYADYRKGKRRSVKLFDDVVNLLVLGKPTGCGTDGACQPQLVVEADGSAYPCDFYCLDEFRLGNLTDQRVSQLLSSPALTQFLQRPHQMPRLCGDCRFRSLCGGNCKRMQREICCSGSDHFCGYQQFLEQCGPVLFRLAQQIKRSLSSQP